MLLGWAKDRLKRHSTVDGGTSRMGGGRVSNSFNGYFEDAWEGKN